MESASGAKQGGPKLCKMSEVVKGTVHSMLDETNTVKGEISMLTCSVKKRHPELEETVMDDVAPADNLSSRRTLDAPNLEHKRNQQPICSPKRCRLELGWREATYEFSSSSIESNHLQVQCALHNAELLKSEFAELIRHTKSRKIELAMNEAVDAVASSQISKKLTSWELTPAQHDAKHLLSLAGHSGEDSSMGQ